MKTILLIFTVTSLWLLFNAHILPPSGNAALAKLPEDSIETMLQQAKTLNATVINKVLTVLMCAKEKNIEHHNILTVIDYSMPASEKRLWVFDLKAKKLLFFTYVSHGIKSGALHTNYFSNKYDSKASSIGVYKTEKIYYGRDGLSLKLDGLDNGFNDNAANRSVVMHGGWYVDEGFIKKYGRAGRSWGCPVLPLNLTKPIIDTIKDNTLFVIYYPHERWFAKSKFLTCKQLTSKQTLTDSAVDKLQELPRDNILFADTNNNTKFADSKPIVVMPTDSYGKIFHTAVPVERMLRRQINHAEYLALSQTEFANIVTQCATDKALLQDLTFVVPEIKMSHGYYATEMKIVRMGKITDIKMQQPAEYTVYFATHAPLYLRLTNRFIRWVGL